MARGQVRSHVHEPRQAARPVAMKKRCADGLLPQHDLIGDHGPAADQGGLFHHPGGNERDDAPARSWMPSADRDRQVWRGSPRQANVGLLISAGRERDSPVIIDELTAERAKETGITIGQDLPSGHRRHRRSQPRPLPHARLTEAWPPFCGRAHGVVSAQEHLRSGICGCLIMRAGGRRPECLRRRQARYGIETFIWPENIPSPAATNALRELAERIIVRFTRHGS